MLDKFKNRSTQEEWMDQPGISRKELFKNLRELDILNRWSGGHQISLQGLKALIHSSEGNPLHVVDLGCGSGDVLRLMARWARKNGIPAKFTGVDKNAHAIDYLNHHCKAYTEISGVQDTFESFLDKTDDVDIIHNALFCHHLNDTAFLHLLKKMKAIATKGFIINDLVRSPMAYYASIAFTRLAHASDLAKNDGPISILRGFRLNEIKKFMDSAGIPNYSLNKTGGFRFLLVGYNEYKP